MSGPAYGVPEEEGLGGNFLSHLPAIFRQRKWLIIVPAILLGLAGLAAAFILPTKYESKAVMLVEAPLLSEDVAGGMSDDVVDQRMARIRQQILSRPQLIELIRQNGLYGVEIGRSSLAAVIEKMRNDAVLAPVTADIQQSGGNRKSSIAFSMSFTYSDPIKAQAVAQALTEQILQLDASGNAEQAANVVRFLQDQANDLQKQIVALEGQISGIKAQNGLALSGMGMFGVSGSTGSYDAQIAALQRDNRQLSMQRDLTKTAADRDPLVSQAEAQLAAARAAYSETHPDVVMAKQRLAEARKLADSNIKKLPLDSVASQIEFNNAQIAALQGARAQESARTSAVIGAQSRGPVVLEQVAQLQKRLDILNTEYAGVSSRLMNARAGKKAEDDQQGERLTVIDPPVVPDSPTSPNRPLLILGGIGAGLGLGLFLAIALEIILKPIRDTQAVRLAIGEAPLVVIPTIDFAAPDKRPWYAKLWPFGRRKGATEQPAE